ncbi:MAG: ring,2-phenylacetyl-CoA epoxidase subunit PaaB [Gaiellaceae bacterium]|jgi:ring-1,2-phenylacetyl-CoA epoxidase subunit PaaB|nr:ring,2-phenylacetyl-CoA epoxidase subunit PaaB [Gaiellaceae bacterium]
MNGRRLDGARQIAQAAASPAPEREVWEVFRRERKGQPFEHAGSVVAPDADFAEAWAREQYGRRGESVALWLVPRDQIRDVEDWADEFDLKYRRVDGYSIKARLKEARERAGTAAPGDS